MSVTGKPGLAKRLSYLPGRARQVITRGAAKNPVLRWSQRTLVAGEHRREIDAVAAGQRRYVHDLEGEARSYPLLRRNVHRLEKGLIMRPRRESFAADYIGATVKTYVKATAVPDFDPGELQWASDVMTAYFATVSHKHPKIAEAHRLFAAAALQTDPAAVKFIPYERDLQNQPVTIEQFEQLCMRRRSVRWYEQRPVDRALIDRALQAAGQAPSACNRQPFFFRIIDDPERAHEIAALPPGTKGFAHQVPVVAALVGRLRAYPLTRDRHAIYIDGALAAMSLMFALESLGLASCAINWPDQEPEEANIRKALDLDADERVIMLIALGWPSPSGMVPRSIKKGLDEMRSYG